MREKTRILFLCGHNSCRSQMAEGWARALRADEVEAFSAGIASSVVDPRAIRVMKEAGVDISGQRSKSIAELKGLEFDYVVTMCGSAREACPVFPGAAKLVHRGFDDPPELAQGAASEDEALGHYRRVRDEIEAWVLGLPEGLEETAGGAKGFILDLGGKS